MDEVTQFQCIFAVERISEHFLLPVLKQLLATFPFAIKAFHSDNGSDKSAGSAFEQPTAGPEGANPREG